MSNLISGKEALIALANGEEVETKRKDEITWSSIGFFAVNIFKYEKWDFRIKHRTITLNGIELPAPFEPKMREPYYFINSSNLKGYGYNDKYLNDGDDECLTFYGAWRTEDEIKQVVAALRSIFNAK